MLYAIVGIPLTLLTITNLGRLLATAFRFLYKNICNVICGVFHCSRHQRLRQHQQALSGTASEALQTTRRPSTLSGKLPDETETSTYHLESEASVNNRRWRLSGVQFVTDIDEIQKVSVPISVSLALIAGYVALGSLLFRFCEDWDYLEASYFCFITLSTIGFGDYVPGTSLDATASQEKLVLCAMYLVFGLAVLAMCFDLMQEEARNMFVGLGRRLGLIDDCDDDEFGTPQTLQPESNLIE